MRALPSPSPQGSWQCKQHSLPRSATPQPPMISLRRRICAGRPQQLRRALLLRRRAGAPCAAAAPVKEAQAGAEAAGAHGPLHEQAVGWWRVRKGRDAGGGAVLRPSLSGNRLTGCCGLSGNRLTGLSRTQDGCNKYGQWGYMRRGVHPAAGRPVAPAVVQLWWRPPAFP